MFVIMTLNIIFWCRTKIKENLVANVVFFKIIKFDIDIKCPKDIDFSLE